MRNCHHWTVRPTSLHLSPVSLYRQSLERWTALNGNGAGGEWGWPSNPGASWVFFLTDSNCFSPPPGLTNLKAICSLQHWPPALEPCLWIQYVNAAVFCTFCDICPKEVIVALQNPETMLCIRECHLLAPSPLINLYKATLRGVELSRPQSTQVPLALSHL